MRTKRRNVLSSPRLSELKKRRRLAVLNKFLILLIGLVVIFGGLAYVSSLKNINIGEIQIVGNKVLDSEILKSSIKDKLAGKHLWLFPKTNILYYSKESIKNALHDRFKRIKDITLTIKDNKILEVTITEREAKYTWCGEIVPVLSSVDNQKCYFMDADGYIFDEAPYFSGGVYFKFYGSIENLSAETPLGFYFLKNKFAEVVKFKIAIEKMMPSPTAFWSDNSGNGNFALSKEPGVGGKIIFKLDDDLEKVAENLQAAISTEPLKSKLKNNLSSLLYIDLRFGNKVYNKFQ
ncbi:MAG: hypothetical protein WCT44_01730 [Candidatus Paceibacterota bacterium]